MEIALPAYGPQKFARRIPPMLEDDCLSIVRQDGADFFDKGDGADSSRVTSIELWKAMVLDVSYSLNDVFDDYWVRVKPQRESSKVVNASEFDPAENINKSANTSLTLQKRIVRDYGMTVFAGEYCELDWYTRFKIIMGICDGLAYLHEQPCIIHKDLKPANILLDENMVPKISDFGLTKTMRGSVGTLGYMAPEYIYSGNMISNKYDVYSLGVIIIEIVTGKRGYSKRSEMSAEEFSDFDWTNRWNFESSSKQVKALDLTVPSTQRDVLDFTNSSEETTRAPIAKKLTDHEAQNHSDPNSCVAKRDTIEKAKCSGEWYHLFTKLKLETDRLLCFEYLSKGNLDMHLFGMFDGLDLQTRYNKIKRICKGLAYLHEECCHMDLKPANILLDENMLPKISDLGLSRCFEGEWTQIMTGSTGIPGYMAPEYINNGSIVSNKSNVFSFGVILVEILTGRAGYSKISEMSAGEFCEIGWRNWWNFESSSKHMKRSNQTVSSTQRAVLDFISAMIFAIYIADLSMALVLSLCVVSALAAEVQHLYRSNLTDEGSGKPRSDRAPETNSSDETTRAPMANKLTKDEAENHSDPNSCVAERDTTEEAKRSGEWYVATGAAHHATGNPDLITNMLELENGGLCVHAADGTPMPVRGRGNVVTDAVVLPDVYYVPGLSTNLVSVSQLAGLDYSVGFGRGTCIISSSDGTAVGGAHARGDGLYVVDFLSVALDMP